MVDVFRDALGELFRSGEVCLFDVIEEVNSILGPSNSDSAETLVEESTCKLLLNPVPPLFLEMSLHGSYLTLSRR